MSSTLLIYGANGYTARLMLPLCASRGIRPILAGRRETEIKNLAEQYGFGYRIFGLSSAEEVAAGLEGVHTVLHCAGPFEITAQPMIEACLKAGVHYLDITGEIGVFELAKRYDAAARQRGIMVMPGTGFDVVPTDCLALALKEKMPDATQLLLAFASTGGGLSHGTATTMARNLGSGGASRKDGKIVSEPLGKIGRWIDFGTKRLFTISIPWGDVSTAYHTTGIPNIRVLTSAKPTAYRALKFQWAYNWLLRTKWARAKAQQKIDARPAGPSQEQLEKGRSLIWGQVSNAAGATCQARYSAPNGYALTADSALHIACKVLQGDFKIGYQTPAGCYGSGLVHQLTQVKPLEWL